MIKLVIFPMFLGHLQLLAAVLGSVYLEHFCKVPLGSAALEVERWTVSEDQIFEMVISAIKRTKTMGHAGDCGEAWVV